MGQGAGGRASVPLLDEPTNRLDVYALEALKKALEEFTGAVVGFGRLARPTIKERSPQNRFILTEDLSPAASLFQIHSLHPSHSASFLNRRITGSRIRSRSALTHGLKVGSVSSKYALTSWLICRAPSEVVR